MRLAARPLALLVPVVLVGALSACTADDPPAAEPASSPASTGTEEVLAAEAEATVLTPDDFVPRLVEAYQEAGSVHVVMTVDAAGTTLRSEGDLASGDGTNDVRMVSEIPGQGPVETILVDGTAYVNLGEATGGRYLRIDSSDTEGPFALLLDQLAAQGDPTQGVRDLEGAITSVEPRGEEEVDGVPTSVYEVVIDTTRVSGAMAAQLEQAGDMLPGTLTYTYWVDADDRMRRVDSELLGATTSLEMTRWGEDVVIEAPPAEQQVDAAELGL